MEVNVTLLIQIVLFLFLLSYLSKFLFEPLVSILDEREKRIDGALKEALEISGSADNKIFEVEEKLALVRATSLALQRKLRIDNENFKKESLFEVNSKMKEKLEQARLSLEEEFKVTSENMKNFIPELSDKILEIVTK